MQTKVRKEVNDIPMVGYLESTRHKWTLV